MLFPLVYGLFSWELSTMSSVFNGGSLLVCWNLLFWNNNKTYILKYGILLLWDNAILDHCILEI